VYTQGRGTAAHDRRPLRAAAVRWTSARVRPSVGVQLDHLPMLRVHPDIGHAVRLRSRSQPGLHPRRAWRSRGPASQPGYHWSVGASDSEPGHRRRPAGCPLNVASCASTGHEQPSGSPLSECRGASGGRPATRGTRMFMAVCSSPHIMHVFSGLTPACPAATARPCVGLNAVRSLVERPQHSARARWQAFGAAPAGMPGS